MRRSLACSQLGRPDLLQSGHRLQPCPWGSCSGEQGPWPASVGTAAFSAGLPAPVQYSTCTVQYLYSTVPVQYSTCTVQYLYSTVPVQYSTCTVQYLYNTVPVQYSTCTVRRSRPVPKSCILRHACLIHDTCM